MNIQASLQQSDESQAQLKSEFQRLKTAFTLSPYPVMSDRRRLLDQLKRRLLQREQVLYQALNQDYGYRSEFDSLLADLMPSVQQLNYVYRKLPKWLKPSRRHAGLTLSPSSVSVHYQPLGVVGVIVPWNFPIFLSLGPIITALAAGNKVMVKMSEFTPYTNQVIRELFQPMSDDVVIIEGESETAAQFSALPFDHLFFTGSTQVGRYVAKAAADNLTPITLELGGKSPVIIAQDAKMSAAVDAIMLGKSINAGQICVAPDYILLPESCRDKFIETYRQAYKKYFADDKNQCRFSNVLDQRQFTRLQSYLEDAKTKGARIEPVLTEGINHDKHWMCPHLVIDVNDEMALMQNEIFGPILPILTYQCIDEAFHYIQARPRPLALYLMSSDKSLQQRVKRTTHSGGVCINDTLMHVAADDAPFGGIGESGMGHYHGIEGFKTFSHARTVLHSPSWLPRSNVLLKNRDLVVKVFRKLFLR
ncbi:coniferyl aldehyde dehydrogenase [Oceanospirillum beijerinckii]|uniref:coniferyl aldehyde dehydrogenase n=1 Tax=Oceanospirillum beijerinckii TaxID=64976 RepID=UPI000685C3FD|nr:coniferyl aldehyde dehydrogenase [Oceanospirillum beijerinckii]